MGKLDQLKAAKEVFKQKTELIQGSKIVFASPYCRIRTKELENYLRASPEERKAMDWLAEQP